MIRGGAATIYVSNMSRAVEFYSSVLGLKMLDCQDGVSTTFDAGNGLILGLHPTLPIVPPPGTRGSISVCLNVTEPLDEVVETLLDRGVSFRGPIQGGPEDPFRVAYFNDPDGNDLFLCETPAPR